MIKQGRKFIVSSLTDGAALAGSKSCDVEINAEKIPVSSPNDGQWEHNIAGRKSWRVTTNHLLPSIGHQALMVGNKYTLNIRLEGEGNTFSGFVDNVALEQFGLAEPPTSISWDKTRQIFVGFKSFKYYNTWFNGEAYTNPDDYSVFTYIDTNYVWLDGVLVPDMLIGQALCTQFHPVGTVGNLLQGSFAFEGDGPLETPELDD